MNLGSPYRGRSSSSSTSALTQEALEKRVLEIDISKCFDRLSHSVILNEMIAPTKILTGTLRCLKAGVNPEFPEQGTPQGGVVSPLLANIALNGVEELHHVIRYADDMVAILKPEDDAEEILGRIEAFLTSRGCSINEMMTLVVRAIDGFDFRQLALQSPEKREV